MVVLLSIQRCRVQCYCLGALAQTEATTMGRDEAEEHEAKLLAKHAKDQAKRDASDSSAGRAALKISIATSRRNVLKFLEEKKAGIENDAAACREDLVKAFGESVPEDFEAKMVELEMSMPDAQGELDSHAKDLGEKLQVEDNMDGPTLQAKEDEIGQITKLAKASGGAPVKLLLMPLPLLVVDVAFALILRSSIYSVKPGR